MRHEELVTNLKKLKLTTIANDYQEMARQSEKVKHTYEQYLSILAKQELAFKRSQKISRLICDAKMPKDRRIETYEFACRDGITEQQIKRLAEGEWVRNGWNVVFFGGFGIGKSHLALGLTRVLCELEFRCHFISTHKLINDLVEAQKNLTLTCEFTRLDKYDLIVLDELGYTPQSKEGADLFFQFISQRYERKSLLITTNLTYSEWDKVFLNPITTAAAVDRIIHKCETFNIGGVSWRAEEAQKRALVESIKKESLSKKSTK
jgi:DNA replication protein DnaC